jgi:hypothetical protein
MGVRIKELVNRSKLGRCPRCLRLSAKGLLASAAAFAVAYLFLDGPIILLSILPIIFFSALSLSHAVVYGLRTVGRLSQEYENCCPHGKDPSDMGRSRRSFLVLFLRGVCGALVLSTIGALPLIAAVQASRPLGPELIERNPLLGRRKDEALATMLSNDKYKAAEAKFESMGFKSEIANLKAYSLKVRNPEGGIVEHVQLTDPFKGEGKGLAEYVMTEVGRTAVVALAVDENLVPRVVYPLGHETHSTNTQVLDSWANCWWDPPSYVWCLDCCDEKYIQCQLQCWQGPWNCPSCMYLRYDCALACCEEPPCPI